MAGSSRLVPPWPFQFKNPVQMEASVSAIQTGFRYVRSRSISTSFYSLVWEKSVLNSTTITTEERKVFDEVFKAFDGFFQIRVNVILERAKFNRRYQKEGEKADEYIAALYNLVETCKYGEQKEEMLRDRLVACRN